LLCSLHLALITILSLLPAWFLPASVTGVVGLDKVVHAGLYGILGALVYWARAADRKGPPRAGWALGAMGYGVLMEVLQLTLSGVRRGFSWGDILANAVGVAAGWLVMQRLLGRGDIHKT
jgi:VanZ family protein